jgi:hypothetical protein
MRTLMITGSLEIRGAVLRKTKFEEGSSGMGEERGLQLEATEKTKVALWQRGPQSDSVLPVRLRRLPGLLTTSGLGSVARC